MKERKRKEMEIKMGHRIIVKKRRKKKGRNIVRVAKE